MALSAGADPRRSRLRLPSWYSSGDPAIEIRPQFKIGTRWLIQPETFISAKRVRTLVLYSYQIFVAFLITSPELCALMLHVSFRLGGATPPSRHCNENTKRIPSHDFLFMRLQRAIFLTVFCLCSRLLFFG